MMLGSNAREDKCRECRGNGTNCRTIAGRIDNPDLRKGKCLLIKFTASLYNFPMYST